MSIFSFFLVYVDIVYRYRVCARMCVYVCMYVCMYVCISIYVTVNVVNPVMIMYNCRINHIYCNIYIKYTVF